MIIIDIEPVGTTLWQSEVNGEVIGNSRTPMLSTARILLNRGVSREARIGMRRKGSTQIDMTGTVGGCAGLNVTELDKGGIYFSRWKPFSFCAVLPPAAV